MKWNPTAGAVSYELEYADNANFTGSTVVAAGANLTYAMPTLADGKRYFWRVRALTSGGNTAWSATQNFGVFLPTSFPNLVFWIRADGNVSTDVVNKVTNWNDESGLGNHIAQSNAAKQPTLVANGLNGKPVVRFSGSNVLEGGDILDINNNSRTSLVIGRTNSTPGTYYAKSRLGAFTMRNALYYNAGSLTHLHHDDVSAKVGNITRTTGNNEMLTAVQDRTARVMTTRINGNPAGTPTTGISASTVLFNSAFRFLVGAYNDANDIGETFLLNGDIAEMIFYDQVFPDTTLQKIEKYLLDKYSPPVDLGADIYVPYGFCDTTLFAGTIYNTYSWSGGGTGNSFNATLPGTYSVTVTDKYGRASVDTIRVFMPNINFTGTPVICLGSTVTWNPQIGSGYTYQWSNATTQSSLTISVPGTYRVTVTDANGCSLASTAVTFTVDSFSSKIDIIAGADTSLCSNNLIGLSRGATLVTNYQWSSGSTGPTTVVDTSGLYSVTVTSANGCTAVDTARVIVLGTGPVVDFVADTVCLGVATRFTDLSTITPPNFVAGWQWDFGNGQTSTDQSPGQTYASAGIFTVSLVATSDQGCASSALTKQVLVHPPVNAFFTDSIACISAPAYFFDRSTAQPTDTLVSWFWDFGNTNTSTQRNAQNIYTQTGSYTATLAIQSAKGCEDTFSRTVTVGTSAPAPQVFYLLSPQPNVNIPTDSVSFNWQKSVGATTYALQVSTSSSFSSLLYNATVVDTAVKVLLPYGTQELYWRVLAYNVCGDQVASNTHNFLHFVPTIITSPLQFWIMADGALVKDANNFVSQWIDQSARNHHLSQSSTSLQPRYISSIASLNNKPVLRFDGSDFLNGGNILNIGTKSRTVFLVGKMNGLPNTYFSKTLLANASNRYALWRQNGNLNSLVQETNSTQVSVPTTLGRYEMLSSITNRLNTTHTLLQNGNVQGVSSGIQPGSDISSTYRFLVGCYNNATDNDQTWYLDGEIAELIMFDTVLNAQQYAAVERYLYTKYSRPVWLGPDITIKYGFCDTVWLDASDRYTSYLWSTGATSTKIKVETSGTYWVEVVDVFGITYTDTINVTLPSVATPSTNTICLGDSIIWDARLGAGYHYLWNTADTTGILALTQPGDYYVTIADTNSPQCTYVTDTFTVFLDSFAITTTLGPDTSLCGGASIGLLTNTQSVIAYSWSTAENTPTIKINNAGTYFVNVLNATGCQASDTIEVAISGRLADVDFTVPSAFCLGDTSYFTNATTIQSPYNIVDYRWRFGANNDTSNVLNPSYLYGASGSYTVTLEVASDSGCVASIAKTVRVFNKPTAKFTYQLGCAGAPLTFADQSIGVTNDPLAQWLWQFGDGQTSTVRNPTHVYAQGGVYEVSLTVTSQTGCFTTFTDTLEVYPELVVSIGADNLCFGETTQLTDASPGFSNVSWQWSFGDNFVSTQKNPTHNYTQVGSYVVILTVKNALGCEKTATDTISIVPSPTADFTYNVACEDFNFRLNDASTPAGNDPIVKWRWEFNDGGPVSNAPNPVRTYDTTGIFPVTLYIESANGCPATITKSVVIAPKPEASFTFTPDYGAAPLDVAYTNTSVGATSYQWFFSDGGYTEDINPVHTFTYNNDFSTTLIATGPGGCKDTATSTLTVNVSTLDIAVIEVDVQNNNGRVRPYATIINQGTRNVGHFYLTSTLGDGSRITERVDSFLQSGTGMIYYFVAGYEATEFQASSFLCIQATQPNDETDDNGLNDRLCKPLENDIRIVPPYPNPTMDVVTFELLVPREEVLDISMYSVLGHKLADLHTGLAAKGTMTFKLDMNGYPRGVYVIRVKFKEDEYILKFVAD